MPIIMSYARSRWVRWGWLVVWWCLQSDHIALVVFFLSALHAIYAVGQTWRSIFIAAIDSDGYHHIMTKLMLMLMPMKPAHIDDRVRVGALIRARRSQTRVTESGVLVRPIVSSSSTRQYPTKYHFIRTRMEFAIFIIFTSQGAYTAVSMCERIARGNGSSYRSEVARHVKLRSYACNIEWLFR